MPRFFSETVTKPVHVIEGDDARHIVRSLRMKAGDELTLCDTAGVEYSATIELAEGDCVRCAIVAERSTAAEPTVEVTLYQGLPKSTKMELIIQKTVELGVTRIVPIRMARSVVKLEEKASKKQERWQKIAAEAAGQCGRGRIPEVCLPLSWNEACSRWQNERVITFYEGGGEPLAKLLKPGVAQCSVVVGPEGGFSLEEIEDLKMMGAQIATLGPRILRCETAPIAALAVIMQLTGNLE